MADTLGVIPQQIPNPGMTPRQTLTGSTTLPAYATGITLIDLSPHNAYLVYCTFITNGTINANDYGNYVLSTSIKSTGYGEKTVFLYENYNVSATLSNFTFAGMTICNTGYPLGKIWFSARSINLTVTWHISIYI